MNSVCLAVLNYDGTRHLEVLLPSLQRACQEASVSASITVLDNRSTKGDVAWVKKNYPEIDCRVAPQNDFLFSYNWLLQELDHDVVVLLNNDLRVKEDFLEPLLTHFDSPDVFAVSASSYDWDGQIITSGPSKLQFRDGYYGWDFDTHRQVPCHTLFCSGGFMAVDRKKFLALGGFDRLFHPAYCEDLDICFRAWRRGWRCIYEPASVVWHREQASWSINEADRGKNLGLSNSFLFQLAHLPLEREKWVRRYLVGRIFVTHTLRFDFHWTHAWLRAIARWIGARHRYRSQALSEARLLEIVQRIQQPLGALAVK